MDGRRSVLIQLEGLSNRDEEICESEIEIEIEIGSAQ